MRDKTRTASFISPQRAAEEVGGKARVEGAIGGAPMSPSQQLKSVTNTA